MKTKEIRDRIKSMGFERAVTYCLEAMNEQHIQTRRDLTELAVMFNKMTDALVGVTNVAEAMKEQVDKFKMTELAEPELGSNTNSLDKEDMQ
jgi:hypothetical protein